ncbi:hypothetical protein D3C73_1252700 [compost metagenome]
MRRGDDGCSCLRRATDPQRDAHAILVDRHGCHLDSQVLQQLSGRRVAGVFDEHAIIGLEQRMGDQRQAIAITRGDEHLGRRTTDTPGHLQVSGNCTAQGFQAQRRGVGHVGDLRGAHAASADL